MSRIFFNPKKVISKVVTMFKTKKRQKDSKQKATVNVAGELTKLRMSKKEAEKQRTENQQNRKSA